MRYREIRACRAGQTAVVQALENSCQFLRKLNIGITVWPSSSKVNPWKLETHVHRKLYVNVHGSSIHSSQRVEKFSVYQPVNVVSPYSVLLIHKNEICLSHCKMDISHICMSIISRFIDRSICRHKLTSIRNMYSYLLLIWMDSFQRVIMKTWEPHSGDEYSVLQIY